MTARPDRAERVERRHKLRAPTLDPTDRVERISEDDVVEERLALHDLAELTGLPELPGLDELDELDELGDLIGPPAPMHQRDVDGSLGWEPTALAEHPAHVGPPLVEPSRLRLVVLESVTHLASAQSAIVAAGHVVVVGATGRGGADRLRAVIGDVDAVLVGLPGGEPLIDAALALGAWRPIVIAAWSSTAVEAAHWAGSAGADLVTVRPHDVERLAPILLAASRLAEQRRAMTRVPSNLEVEVSDLSDVSHAGSLGVADPDSGGFVPFDVFRQLSAAAVERAERYGYPLALAMFGVDPAVAPPAGLRGIVRARAGNALVHAVRDIDVATELDHERFLVLMPYTDRPTGAEVARRIIGAVAAGDPVISGGQAFPPRVIGAVTGARRGGPRVLSQLLHEVSQLLEQAQATGASLAVEP